MNRTQTCVGFIRRSSSYAWGSGFFHDWALEGRPCEPHDLPAVNATQPKKATARRCSPTSIHEGKYPRAPPALRMDFESNGFPIGISVVSRSGVRFSREENASNIVIQTLNAASADQFGPVFVFGRDKKKNHPFLSVPGTHRLRRPPLSKPPSVRARRRVG